MKNIAYKPVLLFAVLFSACAVMDNACLETAETIEPKHFESGVESGIGVDLFTASLLAEDSTLETMNRLGGWFFPAVKVGFGIDEKSDIRLKMWLTLGGIGGRVFYKSRIPSTNPNIHRAIAPGINFIRTEPFRIFDEPASVVTAFGFEIPYISTFRPEKTFRLNWIFRYGYDHVMVETLDDNNTAIDIQSADLQRFGVIGGFSLHPKHFPDLHFNLGVEIVTPLNGKYGYSPIIGIGLIF